MKVFWSSLMLGLAVFLMVGCGKGGNSETGQAPAPTKQAPPKLRGVSVTLDGSPNPQNVGVLMAYERGYFEDVGLKADIHTPILPTRPVRYLTEGVVNLSISHPPQVVLSREKGAPIISVASLITKPTLAMIWLKQSKIRNVAGLKGKTIAIAGLPFEKDFLQSILSRAGLTLADVRVKSIGYGALDALVSGRADAILGSWNIEGAELEARGLNPVVTRAQDFGVPPYEELVLIARDDRPAREKQLIRAFLSALARGTAAAVEDPEAAAQLIAQKRSEPLGRSLKAGVEATLPLLSRDGQMNRDQADQLGKWMQEQGMIKEAPPASELLTNEYLAPQP
jgi:putative hydroxymethylpyrimidine transport system substrate-binding protein